MPADLHIHSTASDGRLTPGEIVEQARNAGLSVIALTDHGTVDGIPAAIQAAGSSGPEVIPGIELNADLEGTEIHILGYCLTLNTDYLATTLDGLRIRRENRAKMIIARLAQLGVRIDYEHLKRVAGQATMGRPHIARVLCEAGYVSSVGEAFDRYLGNGKPAYVTHCRLDPFMAIETVLKAEGIPVLAHPGLAKRDDLIPSFVAKGLLGIEVFYPFHTAEDVARYEKICMEQGLVMTGGTDYHGPGLNYPPLGTVSVPDETVLQLKYLKSAQHRTAGRNLRVDGEYSNGA
jgi:predicted metal-dependent phosphoesterase TrpH